MEYFLPYQLRGIVELMSPKGIQEGGEYLLSNSPEVAATLCGRGDLKTLEACPR